MDIDQQSLAKAAGEVASAASSAAMSAAGSPVFIGGTALAIAAGLAAAVVMLMTKPRDDKEFAVALISTLVSSMGLGAFVILRMGWIVWIQTSDKAQIAVALCAFSGIVFASGLPGWWLVRVAFNTLDKHKNQTLPEAYQDIKHEIAS